MATKRMVKHPHLLGRREVKRLGLSPHEHLVANILLLAMYDAGLSRSKRPPLGALKSIIRSGELWLG